MAAEHCHDCPRCDGYFTCSEDDCAEDDFCVTCSQGNMIKRIAELKDELAVVKDSADKWFTKCRTAEAELAKVKSENEVLTMQLKCADEGLAKSPGMKLWTRAEKLDADNARLRECLKRISEHPHCICGPGELITGHTEGHRCCAEIARKAMKEGE